MISKRIIPCLDICDGCVVKGINFSNLQIIDDPVSLAHFYNENGADELVFYDITASFEQRTLFYEVLIRTAQEIFIPLTVGGNIRTLEDFDHVLKFGADKVSINTGAIFNPDFIESAARKYGSQCVVLSMDVKRVDGHFRVFQKGGREDTGLDALDWAAYGAEHGAGELVVNSIDTDGVKNGFDLELLSKVCNRVDIPVIASGGAGNMEHFAQLFQKIPGVDAGLAASIFHRREVDIPLLKVFLRDRGIEMRIDNGTAASACIR
jgi:cyclase